MDRFDSTNPACPFDAIVDLDEYEGELVVGTPLVFLAESGVITMYVKEIELDPSSSLVGVRFAQ